MKYSIKVDHKLKLLRYCQTGIITKDDITLAWRDLLDYEEFTLLNYNLLTNYSDGKLNIRLSELKEMTKFLKNIENIIKGKKQALVINDPYSVAATILFSENIYKEFGFKTKVFSTIEAGLRWMR